jgi:formylglycine-generating enzyme required for sulfatase activity
VEVNTHKTNPLAFDTTDAAPLLVTVKAAGNAGDSRNGGRGAVGVEYRIGAYEVTNEEYAEFLNAVARNSDVHELYDPRMAYSFQYDGWDPRNIHVTGGINRSLSGGIMTYTVKSGFARKPVNFVSYDSALRYCNWLHNTGAMGSGTESGAYTMSGTKARSASPRYWLPRVDEWYKAAAYDVSSGPRYWLYAYRSDATTADPLKVAVRPLAGLVDVDRPGLPSYFGTYGQSANAAEWGDDSTSSNKIPQLAVLGGSILSYTYGDSGEDVSTRSRFVPTSGAEGRYDVGFRIAARVGLPQAVSRSLQTINFGALSPVQVKTGKVVKRRLAAIASSKLQVAYTSSDPSVAEVSVAGRKVYLLIRRPGNVTITATQEGSDVWSPADPVSRVLTVVPR